MQQDTNICKRKQMLRTPLQRQTTKSITSKLILPQSRPRHLADSCWVESNGTGIAHCHKHTCSVTSTFWDCLGTSTPLRHHCSTFSTKHFAFCYVGFEVFTAVTMKNAVFWDVAPCTSCEINRRFERTYRLHLQGRKIRKRGKSVSRWLQSAATCSRWFLARGYSTLKMEAIRSFETSVYFTGSARRHIPKDGILHFAMPYN
jgi:hypothetical protein